MKIDTILFAGGFVMSSYRVSRERNGSCIRHAAVGVAVSVVLILLVIGAASLIFSLIESIARFAVTPIAFAALALGCFAGGYTYGVSDGRNGVVCGAIIGAAVAFLVIITGFFDEGFHLGSIAFIKIAVMILSGCCGGYIGSNRRCCRKSR